MATLTKLTTLSPVATPIQDTDLFYLVRPPSGNYSTSALDIKTYLNLTSGVPSITGQAGKVLYNDGSSYYWQALTIPTSHTQLSDIGSYLHTQIDTHIDNSIAHIADTSLHMPSFTILDDEKALAVNGGSLVWKEFVDITSSQIITSLKQYSVYPRISSYTVPTLDTQFVVKKYVDDQLDAKLPDQTGETGKFLQTDGSSTTGNLSWKYVMDLDNNQTVGAGVIKYFTELPQQTIYTVPTVDTQLITKKYLEDAISSIVGVSLPPILGQANKYLQVNATATALQWVSSVGSGEVNTASNVGTGQNIFKQKVGVDLEFRTLSATGLVTMATVGDNINIGTTAEANTASNVGLGASIFKQKTGVDLEMKTVVAGTNVSIVENADDITISATGVGEANTASNVGTGEGVFKQKTGTNLEFKNIKAGTNITVSTVGNDVVIDGSAGGETNTASNVGLGSGIFKQKTGVDLELKTLVAGTNITLTNNADDITIDAASTGESNTASNVGTGVDVFKQKTGVDLEFRKILAGTNTSVSVVGDDVVIASTGGTSVPSSVFGDGSLGVLTITSGTVNLAVGAARNYSSIAISGTGVLSTTSNTWGVLDLRSQGNVSITAGGSIDLRNKVVSIANSGVYSNGIDIITRKQDYIMYGAGGMGGGVYVFPNSSGSRQVQGGSGGDGGLCVRNNPGYGAMISTAATTAALYHNGQAGSGYCGGGGAAATYNTAATSLSIGGNGGSSAGANGANGGTAATTQAANGGGGGAGGIGGLPCHSLSIIADGDINLSGGFIYLTGENGGNGGNGGNGETSSGYLGCIGWGGNGGDGGTGGAGGDFIVNLTGTYTGGTIQNTKGNDGAGGAGGLGYQNGVANAAYNGTAGSNIGITGFFLKGDTIIKQI